MSCVDRFADVCLPRSVDALLYYIWWRLLKAKCRPFLSVELHLIIYRQRVLYLAIYYILYSSPAFIRKKRFTEMYAQMAVMKMPKSSTAQAVMAKTCQVMMLSMFSW